MTEQREQSFVCSLNTKPSFFGGFFVFHEILLLRPFETFLFQWNKVKGGVLFIFIGFDTSDVFRFQNSHAKIHLLSVPPKHFNKKGVPKHPLFDFLAAFALRDR